MPLPITLETTTADASMVPSRRSRSPGAPVDGSAGERPVIAESWSSGEELPIDAEFAEAGPLPRSLLDEQLHLGVLEHGVLQHLRPGCGAGIAEIARQVERS